MAHTIHLTSLEGPALAPYVQLTNAQLRSRLEPERGLLIAESPKVIQSALKAGLEPISFLMEPRKLETARALYEPYDVSVYTGERALLAELTGYELTRGVLCALRRPARPTAEAALTGARRVAVLEGLVDAVNLGAVFRSAAALGLDALLLSPDCCDPFCRRAVRVSMGTCFQLPWTYLADDPTDWPEKGLARLTALGFQTVALALREDALDIRDPRFARAERLALLLGNEGMGLRGGTIAACDWAVKIPMARGVDSLNVAAAAAVAFWIFCAP